MTVDTNGKMAKKIELNCITCGLELDWKWSFCPDCGQYVGNEKVVVSD